jgi:hypothetical protein
MRTGNEQVKGIPETTCTLEELILLLSAESGRDCDTIETFIGNWIQLLRKVVLTKIQQDSSLCGKPLYMIIDEKFFPKETNAQQIEEVLSEGTGLERRAVLQLAKQLAKVIGLLCDLGMGIEPFSDIGRNGDGFLAHLPAHFLDPATNVPQLILPEQQVTG